MASPWEEAKAKQKISAPKESKYHGYQGQSGGISSVPSLGKKDAFVNLQRQKFFGDRKDVPEERVLRRTRQEGGVNQFKQALINSGRVLKGIVPGSQTPENPRGETYTVMNPNTGEPVYLTDVPGGRTVGDVSRDFANRFGPTPKEIMGDIGYGASKMLQAYGIPFVSTATKIGSAVSDAWNKLRDYFGTGSQAQGIETQIPQPSSDVKNYFSSMGIDTGIPQVANEDMLVQIAKDKQYENIPFNQLIEGATAENIPQKIIDTATDITLNPIVSVNTPLGEVQVNRLTGDLVTGGNINNLNYMLQGNPLSEEYGANINYGLGKGLGIEAAMESGMTSPYIGLGYGEAMPYGNYGLGIGTNLGTGDNSISGQLGFRPVEYFFGPRTGFNPTVSLGAQLSDQNIEPQLSLNFGYKDGGSVNRHSGLGYMFK